jgi:hypothetical protein
VIGVAVALVAIAVGTAAGADTPFQKVVVVNTPASPVPVVGTVNVGNTPANQNVTVSNFPATQPVSGSVTVANTATKVYNNSASIDAGDRHNFTIPNGMNVIFVRVDDLSLTSESVTVYLRVASGVDTKIFEGDTSFTHDFTVPVATSGIDVGCDNAVLSRDIELNVIGY